MKSRVVNLLSSQRKTVKSRSGEGEVRVKKVRVIKTTHKFLETFQTYCNPSLSLIGLDLKGSPQIGSEIGWEYSKSDLSPDI